jgi:hypothetical protein
MQKEREAPKEQHKHPYLRKCDFKTILFFKHEDDFRKILSKGKI